jgi:kynurenine 3-monooxygenase
VKALVIGGGPVGCVAAIGLRRSGHDVTIYERDDDPRVRTGGRGHSFNLTLSYRGLVGLDSALREAIYAKGTRVQQRVIHCSEGPLAFEPYGILPEHHLLSIQRRDLHSVLLGWAERSGARVMFRHRCLEVNPHDGVANLVEEGVEKSDRGDIVIGSDGANSAVRESLVRSGDLVVQHSRERYSCSEYSLAGIDATGLHLWPRVDNLLIAQPNVDGSYTATLFRGSRDEIGWKDVETVQSHINSDSRSRRGMAPRIVDTLSGAATQLRSVTADRFHCGRVILVGDAAHTMLPFYGQGINCGFEDVRVMLDVLSRYDERDIGAALGAVSTARKPACDAVTTLSEERLHQLMADAGKLRNHARVLLENELYRRWPDRFIPLYVMVAFSTTPYHKAVERAWIQRHTLDRLCARFDPVSQREPIVEAFGNGQ